MPDPAQQPQGSPQHPGQPSPQSRGYGPPQYPNQPYPNQPYPATQRKKRAKWPWLVGALVAIIAIAIGTNTGSDTSNGSADTLAGTNQQDSGAATIGQPARDGKFEFVITDISRTKTIGDEYLNTTAQGEFVIVHLTVKNIGSEPQLLSDSEQYLYDAKDNKYSADSEAGIYLSGDGSDSVWLEEINPGNTVKGKIAFDMPTGAKPVKAELHDSAFSEGVAVTLK